MSAALAGAVAFLRARGAERIVHPGGDLLSHLLRTHALLAAWGASEPLRLAGLCHAAYGTDGFPTSLLAVSERGRLRVLVGEDAERLVYLYGACARSKTFARLGERPLRLTDRFTGAVREVACEEAADFAQLTVANELDVARAGRLGPEAVAAIRTLVAALACYAPAASARALAELPGHG